MRNCADGECVDAAGHGERKHVLPIEISGFLGVLFILFECFTHHVAADEASRPKMIQWSTAVTYLLNVEAAK